MPPQSNDKLLGDNLGADPPSGHAVECTLPAVMSRQAVPAAYSLEVSIVRRKRKRRARPARSPKKRSMHSQAEAIASVRTTRPEGCLAKPQRQRRSKESIPAKAPARNTKTILCVDRGQSGSVPSCAAERRP